MKRSSTGVRGVVKLARKPALLRWTDWHPGWPQAGGQQPLPCSRKGPNTAGCGFCRNRTHQPLAWHLRGREEKRRVRDGWDPCQPPKDACAALGMSWHGPQLCPSLHPLHGSWPWASCSHAVIPGSPAGTHHHPFMRHRCSDTRGTSRVTPLDKLSSHVIFSNPHEPLGSNEEKRATPKKCEVTGWGHLSLWPIPHLHGENQSTCHQSALCVCVFVC